MTTGLKTCCLVVMLALTSVQAQDADPEPESEPVNATEVIQPSATIPDASNGLDPSMNDSDVQALASAFPDPPNADHLDGLASKILGTDLTNGSSESNDTLPDVDQVSDNSSQAIDNQKSIMPTDPIADGSNDTHVDGTADSLNGTVNDTDPLIIDPSPTMEVFPAQNDTGDSIQPSQRDPVSIELPLALASIPPPPVTDSPASATPEAKPDPPQEKTTLAADVKAAEPTPALTKANPSPNPQPITTIKTNLVPGVTTPPPSQPGATLPPQPGGYPPPSNPYDPQRPYNQPGPGDPRGPTGQQPRGPAPPYQYPYPPYPGYQPYPAYPPYQGYPPYPGYPPQYPPYQNPNQPQNPQVPQIPIYQLPGGTSPPISLQSNRNRLCFNRNKFPDLKFPEEKPKYFLIPSGEDGKFSVVAVPTRYNPVVCFPVSYRGNVPILHLPASQSQNQYNPFGQQPQQPYPGYGAPAGPFFPNNNNPSYPGPTIPVPVDLQELLKQFAVGGSTTIKIPLAKTTPTPSLANDNSTDSNTTLPDGDELMNETMSSNSSIDASLNDTMDIFGNGTDDSNSTIDDLMILDMLNMTDEFGNETISNDTDVSLNTTDAIDANGTISDNGTLVTPATSEATTLSLPPTRRPGGRSYPPRRRPPPTPDPRENFKGKHPMRHIIRQRLGKSWRRRQGNRRGRQRKRGNRQRRLRHRKQKQPLPEVV